MNQIQILLKMTGEQRLDQALNLSDFVRELAIKNIKNHFGEKVSKKKIQTELRRRILSN